MIRPSWFYSHQLYWLPIDCLFVDVQNGRPQALIMWGRPQRVPGRGTGGMNWWGHIEILDKALTFYAKVTPKAY